MSKMEIARDDDNKKEISRPALGLASLGEESRRSERFRGSGARRRRPAATDSLPAWRKGD
jgi:hypothetical protein